MRARTRPQPRHIRGDLSSGARTGPTFAVGHVHRSPVAPPLRAMSTLAEPKLVPTHPLRTLLIDDSPSDVRLTRELLKEVDQQSFAVVHAYSLSDAREMVSRLEFDLVLLDLTLPECSG